MMLEAGISGSEFEIRGRMQLNLPRIAEGTEQGVLVPLGCPRCNSWITIKQGDLQGHELVLPSCSAAPALRLLDMSCKSLGELTMLTLGPCDDSSVILTALGLCL